VDPDSVVAAIRQIPCVRIVDLREQSDAWLASIFYVDGDQGLTEIQVALAVLLTGRGSRIEIEVLPWGECFEGRVGAADVE